MISILVRECWGGCQLFFITPDQIFLSIFTFAESALRRISCYTFCLEGLLVRLLLMVSLLPFLYLLTSEKISRFIFTPIYFTRLWIDFIFPNSDPHWARRNLGFYMLCVEVNILSKHVQMCVCVCVLRHVRGHGNGDGQHEIWSPDQSSGNYEM